MNKIWHLHIIKMYKIIYINKIYVIYLKYLISINSPNESREAQRGGMGVGGVSPELGCCGSIKASHLVVTEGGPAPSRVDAHTQDLTSSCPG